MANTNTINAMRQVAVRWPVDQNGHFRRTPNGDILFQQEDGKDTPFQVSKAGIVPPICKLVPRMRAAKRVYNVYPYRINHPAVTRPQDNTPDPSDP